MTLMDRLIGVYENWNTSQNLNLGSADEHMFDEDLTVEQQKWLKRFVAIWEAAERRPNAWGY